MEEKYRIIIDPVRRLVEAGIYAYADLYALSKLIDEAFAPCIEREVRKRVAGRIDRMTANYGQAMRKKAGLPVKEWGIGNGLNEGDR